MPNYDFECAHQHQFEKFIPLSEWKDKMRIPCEVKGCTKEAYQVVLPQGRGSTITPFVYFMNKNGEVRIAPSSNLPTPKGHTRCEVTTLHELRQLEKRVSREERSKISLNREISEQLDAEEHAQNRRDLRHAMESMSEAGKDFARLAMEKSNRKRDYSGYDPGMHFYILHNDDRKREYEG